MIYSDAQLFAGSPFFLTLKEFFKDNVDQAKLVFDLHRAATNTGRIRRVLQTIDMKASTLISSVDLQVGLIPGAPFSLAGQVVSTGKITTEDAFTFTVLATETQVKNAQVAVVPGEPPVAGLARIFSNTPLSNIFSTYASQASGGGSGGSSGIGADRSSGSATKGIGMDLPSLPVGTVFGSVKDMLSSRTTSEIEEGSSDLASRLCTFYLDNDLRITRNMIDDSVYVYSRIQ